MGSASSRTTAYPGQRSSSYNATTATSSLSPNRLGNSIPISASNRPSAPTASTSSNPAVQMVQTLSLPGAYSITPQATSSNTFAPATHYRVVVPDDVPPNGTFPVHAGNRIVRVRCPAHATSGSTIIVSVPPEPIVTPLSASPMPQLTSAYGDVGGGAVLMDADIQIRNFGMTSHAHDSDPSTAAVETPTVDGVTSTPTTQPSQLPTPPPPPPHPPLSTQSQPPPSQQQQQQQPSSQENTNTSSVEQHRQFNVVIPPNIQPGTDFPVNVEGRRVMVRCPPNVASGTTVRISLPVSFLSPPPPGMQVATDLNRPPERIQEQERLNYTLGPPPTVSTQTFDVVVPTGIRPNEQFLVIAAGQRVLLTCPSNGTPGSHVRFHLPVRQPDRFLSLHTTTTSSSTSKTPSKSLLNPTTQDGWVRSLRLSDMKLTWIRTHADGSVDVEFSPTEDNTINRSINTTTDTNRIPSKAPRFQIDKSAYVRNLIFLEGNDKRMRTGRLSLVPASQSITPSSVTQEDGITDLIPYSELVAAVSLPYKEKIKTFRSFCKRIETPWEKGHIRIHIRRSPQYFLDDSLKAILSLSPADFRKIWRFEFIGEDGIDAGGLAREWFHLITMAIFDADRGLWLTSPGANQTQMHINASSALSCPEDHLIYFRFLGRVCGKALFDEQLISSHMVDYLYKHLLGWPVTFEDLQSADENVYSNLKKLFEMTREDIANMCLDFTLQEETMLGVKNEVELVKDGKNMEVTVDNLDEYMEANLKYRLMDKILPQLTELLLGFFDVIPEALITIFDYRELELALCGIPEINVKDWMDNTNYSGTFSLRRDRHPTCVWFWDIVTNDFDQEMRAKLLQFVTGTSGVPARGFSVLQGNDGNIKTFTINGIDSSPTSFPRAQ